MAESKFELSQNLPPLPRLDASINTTNFGLSEHRKRIFNNRNMLMTIMRSIFMYYEIQWSLHTEFVPWFAHGISLTISMRRAWKKNFRVQTNEFFRANFSQCLTCGDSDLAPDHAWPSAKAPRYKLRNERGEVQ
jgi:hypothetical protein